MKNKTKAYFEFHVCFQEPNSNEAIGFEIYFSWRIPGISNSVADMERGQRFSESLLKVDSNLIEDEVDFRSASLFQLRYSPNQTHIVLRRGRDRFRTQLTGCGSGGNWYWEVFLVPASRQAHMMNWLRRRKHIGFYEWNTEFRETIWDRRGPIRIEHLRAFKRKWIAEEIERERRERCDRATDRILCEIATDQKEGSRH